MLAGSKSRDAEAFGLRALSKLENGGHFPCEETSLKNRLWVERWPTRCLDTILSLDIGMAIMRILAKLEFIIFC
jgi:hypothetical protein